MRKKYLATLLIGTITVAIGAVGTSYAQWHDSAIVETAIQLGQVMIEESNTDMGQIGNIAVGLKNVGDVSVVLERVDIFFRIGDESVYLGHKDGTEIGGGRLLDARGYQLIEIEDCSVNIDVESELVQLLTGLYQEDYVGTGVGYIEMSFLFKQAYIENPKWEQVLDVIYPVMEQNYLQYMQIKPVPETEEHMVKPVPETEGHIVTQSGESSNE